jgi:hypothetical protein
MLGQFWSGLGGKLAEQWLPAIVTPAFVFWTGGLFAWASRYGWAPLTSWFVQQPTPLQVAILVAALLLVLASGVAMQRLTFPTLRLLEGYWPWWAHWAHDRLVARHARRYARIQEQYQILRALRALKHDAWPLSSEEAAKLAQLQNERPPLFQRRRARLGTWFAAWVCAPGPPELVAKPDINHTELEKLERRQRAVKRGEPGFGAALAAELAASEGRMRRLPANATDLMPTTIGNVLRASERRVRERVGLDPIVCWPRLWLVMPEGSKTELTEARTSVNLATQVWVWAVLFLAWTIWAWWAIPVAVSVLYFAYYQWLVPATGVYGDLFESAFDVHRIALYQALRWPLPTNPAQEQVAGSEVTEYLVRGPAGSLPVFTEPEADKSA